MIQAVQELWFAIFAAALLAAAASQAIRMGSKTGAWIGVAAFLSFSLLVACALWRLL